MYDFTKRLSRAPICILGVLFFIGVIQCELTDEKKSKIMDYLNDLKDCTNMVGLQFSLVDKKNILMNAGKWSGNCW